jgi:hypothetical protein
MRNNMSNIINTKGNRISTILENLSGIMDDQYEKKIYSRI